VPPDLQVERIELTPGPAADSARYLVTLRNAGRTAARSPFTIGLSVGGAAQPAEALPSLAAGESATVAFLAPRCVPGTTLAATADPDDTVDEADESDNATLQICPAA
jgi:subtilase family serine protease